MDDLIVRGMSCTLRVDHPALSEYTEVETRHCRLTRSSAHFFPEESA